MPFLFITLLACSNEDVPPLYDYLENGDYIIENAHANVMKAFHFGTDDNGHADGIIWMVSFQRKRRRNMWPYRFDQSRGTWGSTKSAEYGTRSDPHWEQESLLQGSINEGHSDDDRTTRR